MSAIRLHHNTMCSDLISKLHTKTMLMTGLNFKLKTYNTIDPAKKTEPGGNPWVKMVQYYPENLDKESAEFVESLGHFAQEFKFPRPQLSEMMDSLRGVLEG